MSEVDAIVKYFEPASMPAVRYGVIVVPTHVVGRMVGHELARMTTARWYESKLSLQWPNGSWLGIMSAMDVHAGALYGIRIDTFFILDPDCGCYRTVEGGIDEIEMQLQLRLRRAP